MKISMNGFNKLVFVFTFCFLDQYNAIMTPNATSQGPYPVVTPSTTTPRVDIPPTVVTTPSIPPAITTISLTSITPIISTSPMETDLPITTTSAPIESTATDPATFNTSITTVRVSTNSVGTVATSNVTCGCQSGSTPTNASSITSVTTITPDATTPKSTTTATTTDISAASNGSTEPVPTSPTPTATSETVSPTCGCCGSAQLTPDVMSQTTITTTTLKIIIPEETSTKSTTESSVETSTMETTRVAATSSPSASPTTPCPCINPRIVAASTAVANEGLLAKLKKISYGELM